MFCLATDTRSQRNHSESGRLWCSQSRHQSRLRRGLARSFCTESWWDDEGRRRRSIAQVDVVGLDGPLWCRSCVHPSSVCIGGGCRHPRAWSTLEDVYPFCCPGRVMTSVNSWLLNRWKVNNTFMQGAGQFTFCEGTEHFRGRG